MQTKDTALGFLTVPEIGPCPCVVLIHDVWGLTDHARDLAQRLSGEGFAVLALDL
ncbi:MAG: dienelactone hydrolase family protein, partial [Myxococcota bacterium]